MADTRTLAHELRELVEVLYGQANAAGDDMLSERCSAAMEAVDTLPGLDEPLRIEAGGEYASRDGRRVRVLATDYRYAADAHLCLAVVCDVSGDRERVELYTLDGRRYLGRGIDPLDIAGPWHDGLNAHAPAVPDAYAVAAE